MGQSETELVKKEVAKAIFVVVPPLT